jgi:tRNA(Ile)-lysidine synthase
MAVLNRMMDFCKSRQLIAPGDKIVAAVSGGPDSVALLHLLKRLRSAWGLTIIAAHVNHGFRGEESDKEAELVRGLAREWGVPCESVALDMPALLKREGGNPQDAARAARYRFLAETAERHDARLIALAHHADDQAETVLMRMLRGAGPDGLEGIPVRRPLNGALLIRPLLIFYKKELLDYCRRHGLRYAEDSSNRQRKYVRNRLRLDVIPYLERFNPQLVPALARMADIMSEEQDYMLQETRRRFEAVAERTPDGIGLARRDFLADHVALQRRLIKLILSYLCPDEIADFSKVERVREALAADDPATIRLDLGGGVRLVREYDDVRFTSGGDSRIPAFDYVAGSCPAVIEIPEIQAVLTLRETEPGPMSRLSPDEARFDRDAVRFPLTVRNRRPGDRIALPGMNGRKKVKDLFIDEKIPPSHRERFVIVEDADGRILWVAGLRRSAHAEAGPHSSRILHMHLHKHIHY